MCKEADDGCLELRSKRIICIETDIKSYFNNDKNRTHNEVRTYGQFERQLIWFLIQRKILSEYVFKVLCMNCNILNDVSSEKYIFFFVNSWWPTYEKCETQTTLGRNQHPLLLRPMLWKPRYFRARLSILERCEQPTIFLLILVAADAANVPVRTAVKQRSSVAIDGLYLKRGTQRIRLDLIWRKICGGIWNRISL